MNSKGDAEFECKADLIWSCYTPVDANTGLRACKLLDANRRSCSQSYAGSTRSTNPGAHIMRKHAHCKDVIAQLNAFDTANQSKKRRREEDNVLEPQAK